MLRNNPKPPGKYCLSIDPGTQNAGVCAFDSTSQTIVYWNRHKLLDVHEQVVHSTDQVKRYLYSITDNVEATLKSNDYWVLVEEQPWDSDSKKGIVFNLQLQQAIVMYFLCEGKAVRVLNASERYKFLGIRNWQQMTRHFHKVSTANAVRQLLEASEGNLFAGRNHDLRVCQAAGENQHDMADALGQLLCYFYRNRDAVVAGRVVEAELTNRLVAPEQRLATSSAQRQQQQPSLRYDRSSSGSASAGPSSSQKKAKHDSAARHLQARARLQKTLTQLQAEHPELLPRTQGSAQQQSTNAEKLYKVYKEEAL
jgi:Holliday junction resolvasome RuvABC endonuclease subunit